MSIEIARKTTSRRHQEKDVRAGFLILIAAFTMSMTAAIAGPETDQELLNADSWPITVEGAVDDLLSRIPPSEKLRIKRTKKEDTISLYFDLGALIRNRYGLWRGNDKLIFSACGSRCHPDDAAMKIIEILWRELQR